MDYFDLHCDTACHLVDHGRSLENGRCHVALKKASALGGRYGQVFALFIDDRYSGKAAYRRYLALRDELFRQLQASRQALLCQDAGQMESTWGSGRAAALLSVENGTVLGGKLDMLLQLQNDGVKLLTLTWFGENELGFGSQVGGPLKPFGLQVLDALPQYGILPDISHLSDEGVEQVLERYAGPLVASHSGARRACGHYRNLTDRQIRQIVARDGLIGVNFFSKFLSDHPGSAGFEDIRRHLEAFWENGAQDHLAFGSDFDGAEMPRCLHRGLADIPALWEYLSRCNYPQGLLQKLFFENARRFFARHLI